MLCPPYERTKQQMSTHQKHPPSTAGIGAPLVPAEGRDEPRKTAKCGKPTQMAQDVLFATNTKTKKAPQKKEKKSLLYILANFKAVDVVAGINFCVGRQGRIYAAKAFLYLRLAAKGKVGSAP